MTSPSAFLLGTLLSLECILCQEDKGGVYSNKTEPSGRERCLAECFMRCFRVHRLAVASATALCRQAGCVAGRSQGRAGGHRLRALELQERGAGGCAAGGGVERS